MLNCILQVFNTNPPFLLFHTETYKRVVLENVSHCCDRAGTGKDTEFMLVLDEPELPSQNSVY